MIQLLVFTLLCFIHNVFGPEWVAMTVFNELQAPPQHTSQLKRGGWRPSSFYMQKENVT